MQSPAVTRDEPPQSLPDAHRLPASRSVPRKVHVPVMFCNMGARPQRGSGARGRPRSRAGGGVAPFITSNRPRARSVTGAALVAYYSAATTLHVLSGDSRADSAPAAAFGAVAATIVCTDTRHARLP